VQNVSYGKECDLHENGSTDETSVLSTRFCTMALFDIEEFNKATHKWHM